MKTKRLLAAILPTLPAIGPGRAGLRPGHRHSRPGFSYALAKVLGEPLLYKGDDFSQTDVSPFVQPPAA